MAYEKQTWKAGDEITSERLNHLEEGVGQIPEKGDPGKQGNPGKNGFGTEEQYQDIISRLEALEEPPAEG